MRRSFPWSTLGIDADADEPAIRRAYATKLKAMDPDADHKGFQRLRDARDRALALARSRAAGLAEAEEEAEDDWYDDEEESDLASEQNFAPSIAPAPVPYGGIPVDVLPGEQAPLGPPTLDGDGDPSLSVPSPQPDEAFAAPPPRLTLSRATGTPGEGLAEGAFPVAPPVLGSNADQASAVTPAALVTTIDGTVATSQDALYRLMLQADPDEPLTAEEVALVSSHLDVILGDPRMDEIGYAGDMEHWLAQIFARSTPRSHPFVQRLADQFGWRADAGNLNQPYNIAWLADRALAFDFRDRVTQPDNKGYRAWIELTTPGKRRAGTRYVRELLTTIRTKHPVLEAELDWHKVGQWDGGSAVASGGAQAGKGWGANAGWIIVAVIGGLQVLGAIARNSDSPNAIVDPDRSQSIAVQIAEFDDPERRRVTIDDVLRKVGGSSNDVNWLEASKPQLFEKLDSELAELKTSRGALENAEPDLEAILYRRIRGNLTTAPYSLLVGYRRAQSAMLREMAEVAPRDCPRLATSGALPVFAASFDATEDYQVRSAAMLIAGDRDEPEDAPIGFEALNSTIEDAARRADMSLDYWRRVYSGNAGEGRDYCIVNASIIDAAIAAPREESDRLLRDL